MTKENKNHSPTSMRHVMLLPSLACQASCEYCFGPNRGVFMYEPVFDAALKWIEATQQAGQTIELTFHGGEPLLIGLAWYRRALPLLRVRFGEPLRLSLQSNLWQLDNDSCSLFREYGVSLGTSLDGPESINDAQRGKGYFARTMRGIETAHRHGLDVGVICTFTRLSASHYHEVFDFFASEGLAFSVHGAVPALNGGLKTHLTLSPQEYADLFIGLFDYYQEHIKHVRISTFDQMASGLSARDGGLCTFSNCLGRYLTIGAEGGIYPCNRFAHDPNWRLGFVQEKPSFEMLAQTSIWRKIQKREECVEQDCGNCPHFECCKGGCAYNALANGRDRRDAFCEAYRRIFDHITERALEQVFSEENLKAIIDGRDNGHGLMRKGPLLQIMRGAPHPQKVASRAREIVASVGLAISKSPSEALEKLDCAGLITQPSRALGSLENLWQRLHSPSQQLLNGYIHVTYNCNLSCSHCYAASSPDRGNETMPVERVSRTTKDLTAAGFNKVIITGGEPFYHPECEALLAELAALRQEIKPAHQLVLRTNLAYKLTPDSLEAMASSVDQIVISVDGNQASHDARRGKGTYELTVANLRSLVALKPMAKVVITAGLTSSQIYGSEGKAVRTLAEQLGVGVRFKPVLPIGRAASFPLQPEFDSSLLDSIDSVAYGNEPCSTCGLGMNLYVGPKGECYPCYALMGECHNLGNIFAEGTTVVLERNHAYRRVTVDSNRHCRHCMLRYLCGGHCRAWSIGEDPDAPPVNCVALQERAWFKLQSALEILDVQPQRWQAAGLPLLTQKKMINSDILS